MKNKKVLHKQQVRKKQKQLKKEREKEKKLQLKIEQKPIKQVRETEETVTVRSNQEEQKQETRQEEKLGFEPNALGKIMMETVFPYVFLYGNEPLHKSETPQSKNNQIESEDNKEKEPVIIDAEYEEIQ